MASPYRTTQTPIGFTLPVAAKFHGYSLTVIRLSLEIVVAGGLSFRAMQTVWAALASVFGETPSYSGVRLWLYRVGLYL